MDRYRKLKVIGKGSFGYAVQVQSVADRHTYVMKVSAATLAQDIEAKTYLQIIDVSKMDRKQREDAINEVGGRRSVANRKSDVGTCSIVLSYSVLSGTRAKSYASSLHHHLQGVLHGQALSLYRHGLRGRWRPLHQNREPKENRQR